MLRMNSFHFFFSGTAVLALVACAVNVQAAERESGLSSVLQIVTSADDPVMKVGGESQKNMSPLLKGAMGFVDSVGKRGIGILSNKDLSDAQRKQSFRALLNDSFDLTTIGRFALGRYWRVATSQQRGEYQRLFERMVIEVYNDRFSSYSGQQLKTESVKMVNATDVIVTTFITSPEGGEKVQVDWRVRNTGGGYHVVDVVVEGVSMSVTQRSDFASVIQRGGGDIDVLINHLRQLRQG